MKPLPSLPEGRRKASPRPSPKGREEKGLLLMTPRPLKFPSPLGEGFLPCKRPSAERGVRLFLFGEGFLPCKRPLAERGVRLFLFGEGFLPCKRPSAERGVRLLGFCVLLPYAQGSSDAGTRMSARKPNWVTNHCPVLGFLRRLMGRGLSAPPDWMYSVASVST